MEKWLFKSAKEQKPIIIIYVSKDSSISKRIITVKKINQDKILAFCHLKKQYRTFTINQILAVQLIEKQNNSIA